MHNHLWHNSMKYDELFMDLGNILPALTTGCICGTSIDSRQARNVATMELHSCKSKRSQFFSMNSFHGTKAPSMLSTSLITL